MIGVAYGAICGYFGGKVRYDIDAVLLILFILSDAFICYFNYADFWL